MSLSGVFPALISDAPTLSSGHRFEQNSPPVGAILVDLGGDLCVNIICEQIIDGNRIINSIGVFE